VNGEVLARPGALYPPIQPLVRNTLDVGGGHEIFYEVNGNPTGKPALFLHGGPGGGCYADHRRLFDPERYRIVLFDQRGCGKSKPTSELAGNTTWDLVEDIERLRVHLGVERFVILGGSWGAALALLYAQTHPTRVEALVLRGVFTARRREIDWLYRHGASALFPERWDAFASYIPESERDDLPLAYHRRLTSGDAEIERDAARAWCTWEGSLMSMTPRASTFTAGSGEHTRALARIEAHYFVNNAFIEEGRILRDMPIISKIPGIIVQGRYDVVTPPITAYEVHKTWPSSRLDIVNDAGHATSEPGITRKLVEATDFFAR
jgi:proline iminopeptidase